MIQTVLFFGLGFLTATFLGLMIAPALRRRTERLTARRIEARLPMSREEIQADRDRLRAEAALAQRRIEIDLKAARTRVAEQMIELGRRDQAIAQRAEQAAALQAAGETLQAHGTTRERWIAQLEARLVTEYGYAFRARYELERLGTLYEDASYAASDRQIEIARMETELDRVETDLAALRAQHGAARPKSRPSMPRADASELTPGFPMSGAEIEAERDRLAARLNDLGADPAGPDTPSRADERAELRIALKNLAAQMVLHAGARTGEASSLLSAEPSAEGSLAERIRALGAVAAQPVQGDR